jgi:hypothetical protein
MLSHQGDAMSDGYPSLGGLGDAFINASGGEFDKQIA